MFVKNNNILAREIINFQVVIVRIPFAHPFRMLIKLFSIKQLEATP
jgi:hypothetical protein